MKIRCSLLITALITALSVFLGTISKSEFKSQMKKRKLRKQEQVVKAKILDNQELEEPES